MLIYNALLKKREKEKTKPISFIPQRSGHDFLSRGSTAWYANNDVLQKNGIINRIIRFSRIN